MDQYYMELLKATLQQRIILCVACLSFAILSLVLAIIPEKEQKQSAKNKNARMRKRRSTLLACAIILFCVVVYMVPTNILTLRNDIKKNQITETTGYYKFDPTYTGYTNWPSNGYVYITIDGECNRFDLPKNWTQDMFPYGYYYGNVAYGTDSMILLAFIQE